MIIYTNYRELNANYRNQRQDTKKEQKLRQKEEKGVSFGGKNNISWCPNFLKSSRAYSQVTPTSIIENEIKFSATGLKFVQKTSDETKRRKEG